MNEFLRRLRFLFSRARFERELEEEMRHHLALRAEQGSAGNFGNIALIREDSRTMWTFVFWEQLAQDIRYGIRAMASNRTFTLMAVLSLALGIGANTAIYSFLHAVLLRSLPVRNPSELVVVNWSARGRAPVVHGVNGSMFGDPARGQVSPNFPYAAWETLRRNTDVAASVFSYARLYQINVQARNQAEIAQGLCISGNFSDGLGLRPAIGRLIGESDDKPGAANVAVLSSSYWQRRFGSDPAALGQTVLINNTAFTIVGVFAPGFYGVDSWFDPPVFLPLHAVSKASQFPGEDEKKRFGNRNFYWLEMMARLRPGVTLAQAQTTYAAIFRQYVLSTASTEKEKTNLPQLWLEDGAGGLDSLRRQYSKPLYILMGMVGLILIIACANIANLLLARSTARRREMAIRMSLGAGRLRIVRQLLTESLMLSAAGGLLGIAVAVPAIRSITALLSSGADDLLLRASLNWPVLGFTMALAMITGVVFGLAPALQSTGRNVVPALKEARIGATRGSRRFNLSKALIVSQVGISLLLVLAAGLFVRTLVNLHSVNLGFNKENILLFTVNARSAGYKDESVARFYGNLADTMRRIPGVRSAGMSDYPLASQHWDDEDLTLPGVTPASGKTPTVCVVQVNEGFLSTMRIPTVLGRAIEARDIGSPKVAVVTEKFAQKFFPGENPVGHLIGIGKRAPDIEIIGVAKTSVYNRVKETDTPPVAYIPYTQDVKNLYRVTFELRSDRDPLVLANTVRQIVHDASPAVPVTHVTTQAAQIDETIAQERTFANLCTCFAILALVIACVGLYGTMAYAVARRTSEIGIRVALGAARRRIIWMVLSEVMAVVAVGLVIGLAVAWETSHFVASFLFGVKPNDPWAMFGAAGVLIAAAVLAGYAPARRASRIDPMVALRHE